MAASSTGHADHSTTTNNNNNSEPLGVRFASHAEEIAPPANDRSIDPAREPAADSAGDHGGSAWPKRTDITSAAARELAQLKSTLKNNIQSSRMQHHAFEPISLPGSTPVSRVTSGTTTTSSRPNLSGAGSSDTSPHTSPPASAVHSPPLTPAATTSREGKAPASPVAVVPPQRRQPAVMTPQRSVSPPPPRRDDKPSKETAASVQGVAAHPHHAPKFTIGPSGDSEPPSQEASPSGTPASTAPSTPRPRTPVSGYVSDPPTRAKRYSSQLDPGPPPQNAKYRFGDRDPSQGYANSGQSNINLPAAASATQPRTSASGTSLRSLDSKRSSFFGGGKKSDDSATTLAEKDTSHSSRSNLKRFFKFGDHKHHHHHKDKHANGATTPDGTRTPPRSGSSSGSPSIPFADDHGLAARYGKFGKVLGSGAGGSVRLMRRTADNTVFAVKQFRDRHPYESEKEYNKKVTAEFCIGSTLHHGNIIETIDIIHEKGKWYEVMEYAPYDLFATVMTGKMGREEITCATLQILSGVLYLHSMGLGHRDLKLDNVVINEHGIMKLIDFGSAVVFRYPFENDIVLASGVVGSDPYLAPEVYDNTRYDPRPADVWSIAIIFCCMSLRRFPWKAPRISDNSYRLFVAPPDPDQDKLLEAHQRSIVSKSAPASRNPSISEHGGTERHHTHHHHHADHSHNNNNNSGSGSTASSANRQSTPAETPPQPTVKGPLRLLRLLPRETRHIIGRMLELDPKKRATMDEILSDPWVENSLVCRQEENGVIIKAPNHTHTLQPSSAGAK